MDRRLLLALVAGLSLAGCATVPGQDRLAQRDPLEKFNRAMWSVNMTADKVIVKPVTQGYRAVAPRPVRQGVHNFFTNLTEPWSFVNNLLQGKPKRAGRNLGRFVVNTTIGVAGLFDRATKIGIRPAPEDLGQTLAVWGVNAGPYLVLPLLGPSTLRDGVGSAGAFAADPVNVGLREGNVSQPVRWGYRIGQVIDARSELIETGGQGFLDSSLDSYAATRSAYLQRRRAQVLDREDDADAGSPDEDADALPAETPPAESAATPIGDAVTAAEAPTATAPVPPKP